MIDKSVTKLYEHLYNILYNVVSPNVYIMNIPTDLTESDKTKGFIVILNNQIEDNSEFPCNTYGESRVNIVTFVPPMKRGRANIRLYKQYEQKLDEALKKNINSEEYFIDESSLLEYSDFYNSNGITFNMLFKSYNIIINNKN